MFRIRISDGDCTSPRTKNGDMHVLPHFAGHVDDRCLPARLPEQPANAASAELEHLAALLVDAHARRSASPPRSPQVRSASGTTVCFWMDEVRVRGALNLIAGRSLSGRECRILCAVAAETVACGREFRRLTSVDLARMTGIRDWHVRGIVGGLEKKGLVRRVPSGNAYEVGLSRGDVSRDGPAIEDRSEEIAVSASAAPRPSDAEVLREQAEQTRGASRPVPMSEALVDLRRMTNDDVTVRELGEQLEAAGGGDLLRRAVDQLRAWPRSESGLLLADGDAPREAADVAREMLRVRLRAAEALF
jgi:hypothetical protein